MNNTSNLYIWIDDLVVVKFVIAAIPIDQLSYSLL